MSSKSQIQDRARFDQIRYAQCWEDADQLVAALQGPSGRTFLSVASAGDNSLALLTLDPARVLAVDLNPTQLHCLELRVAAYRHLDHAGLLRLLGSRPADDRAELYARCRQSLSAECREWWDAQPDLIAMGIGAAGRFERYFRLFSQRVLPLVHSRKTVQALLQPRDPAARRQFYQQKWNTWRWRLLFRLFFSRWVMGRLGRDPAFFQHVDGAVAPVILERTRHALAELDPSANPYLHWILNGTHGEALPLALRPEHFDTIRNRLDRIEWRLAPVEAVAEEVSGVDGYNLSDIFEYMDMPAYSRLLQQLAERMNPGGRLVYWNLFAPRTRPEALSDLLQPEPELAEQLHGQGKAFFYGRFVVETRK
ncbi:DUF3419 family protein [Natronospirillum operosum]|uniref:DUF3419 family protein n=1 Tax=Natronospirillum operosum TaxID=2759953 RepID=A0A4Z0WHW7_9GAMM|nr:DUF3419 family protein [Natronospirillum operosum]TGG95507.1 DUF3419 family protein [Natronospirillum operosum]